MNRSIDSLYAEHVATRQREAEAALAASGYDALVLSSGTQLVYYADDAHVPHHETPHFAAWVPLEGPGHLLVVSPGKRPALLRFAPEDFWYEQTPLGNPPWAAEFELDELGKEEDVWKRAARPGRVAYVGDAPDEARRRGFDPNPEGLLARLDWNRSYKTPYEAACVAEATRKAARGHEAARAAFEAGASELELHHAYVEAVGVVDRDLPYASIVALDAHGATLHYDKKRTERNGRVLLIDAGARERGYAADITRTWTTERCDPTFRELVAGVDALQQELCAAVRPGLPYPELHHRGHVAIGELLRELGVLDLGGEDAVERGLTRPFFPHGLGHFLGIQVHDVAGHQAGPGGGTNPPDAKHPYLRTTRAIEPGMLFTVEPGVYFIPMLLRSHRSGPTAQHFDWELVDRLTPFGGVRIEDNLYVTATGAENLTRPHI
jgi:Xaa-Pro dipeptidase